MGRVLILLALVFLPVSAEAERLFGLVVGIDDYAFVPDLHGAVNDAEDIADALATLGAEVTLLTDADATRAAILGSWEAIIRSARPGDRLVVSYAGHGSNEPEHRPGSEADGRDENFLLAGFAPHGTAASERILDDEIADLLARSADLEVIFIADACHSGTVTRDLNPTLGYRYVTPARMETGSLPPPPPPPSGDADGKDSVELFLAAVSETEKVPEVLIDGTPRGALSYAFAAGLRGAADLDGDRILTKGEIEAHVRRTVRQVSDGAQMPQSEPAGRENAPLVALPSVAPIPQVAVSLTERGFAELPPVSVSPHGAWVGVTGVRATGQAQLRREGATIYSSVGDRLAHAAGPRTLQAVADKHRLVAALNRIAASGVAIGFNSGDRVYRDGETLVVYVEDRSARNLTLLNLAADGTISILYPLRDMGDPASSDPSERVVLPVGVMAPFGADHVIAIETDGPATALRKGLALLEGGRDMAALWDLLRRSGGRVDLFPFFTEGGAL